MLSPAEMQATSEAVAAALAAVERAEAAARDAQGVIGRTFLPGRQTRAAEAMRATYDAILAVRQGAIDSTDDEHELAAQVVQNAAELAAPGFAASIAGEAVTAGDAIDDKAADLVAGLPALGAGVMRYARIALVVGALVVAAYVVNAAARLRRPA